MIFSLQFTKFLEAVRSGAFQTMATYFLRGATNNHGFGDKWDLDVTIEGVPQQASGDDMHAPIFTDEEETM